MAHVAVLLVVEDCSDQILVSFGNHNQSVRIDHSVRKIVTGQPTEKFGEATVKQVRDRDI